MQTLTKSPTKINYKGNREINGKIILEQTLIKDGIDEILIIGESESQNDITCSNGKENDAKEKLSTAPNNYKVSGIFNVIKINIKFFSKIINIIIILRHMIKNIIIIIVIFIFYYKEKY